MKIKIETLLDIMRGIAASIRSSLPGRVSGFAIILVFFVTKLQKKSHIANLLIYIKVWAGSFKNFAKKVRPPLAYIKKVPTFAPAKPENRCSEKR
jgi:hypothetical protein